MKQIGFSLFILTIFLASMALPQSSATKKKTTPKITAKASAKTSAKTSSRKATAGRKSRPAVTRQMAPTPDRYRDIQQSLVEKGYLKSEPSGVWDAQSSDALKQFQIDKNLSPTGKISSATLIALGLGPKTAVIPPVTE
jgi:peptidoglycan hydrolase-like protein with peptidoglycan-binding domain